MAALQLIRLLLLWFSAWVGGMGVFSLYIAWTAKPAMSIYAVIFFGSAGVIAWFLNEPRRGR